MEMLLWQLLWSEQTVNVSISSQDQNQKGRGLSKSSRPDEAIGQQPETSSSSSSSGDSCVWFTQRYNLRLCSG